MTSNIWGPFGGSSILSLRLSEDSEMQVTGEYMSNYLKEMDGDDSQFKDCHGQEKQKNLPKRAWLRSMWLVGCLICWVNGWWFVETC